MPSCLPSTLAISQIPHSHSIRSPPFFPKAYTKEVYFNHDLSTTKKLQAGVDLVADLLGVTLGPKGRNVVLENKYGPPKIVNDGETILKEVELQDPLENVGVKLVRQAAAKTNDIVGDGSTTAIVLARGLIDEGVKVISAGMNPIQVVRGIEKTAKALVSELRLMSREIEEHEIADVAAVSAGNDYSVGNMIADALRMVRKKGFIRIETGRCTENRLEVVEGMQFERGYLSPYFVTDRASMSVEFSDCKILLVDKKITNPKEILGILDEAKKGSYSLLLIAEGFEEEALAPIIRNKLKGLLKVAAIKAPAFGERKSDYLDDIAILTGGTVIRDDVGLTLEKAGVEVLGSAVKVVITKDSTLLVTDGSTQALVEKRIVELRNLVENTEEKFDKKIINERIARLSDGIAIIQVGAQTVVELKDKKLRVEDALSATRAAIEEGVVVGGGCYLLRLSMKVDSIKDFLDNEEQKWRDAMIFVDTEFPGTIYNSTKPYYVLTSAERYALLKANVEEIQPIQVGITICYVDRFTITWQFDICDFNISLHPYVPESITLLESSGINLKYIRRWGVPSLWLAQLLINSGLIGLGSEAKWVVFQGGYDIAILLKAVWQFMMPWRIMMKSILPPTLEGFMAYTRCIFGGGIYDIKCWMRVCGLYGGLERLAKQLMVERKVGKPHQAGSDCLLICHVFFRMMALYFSSKDDRFDHYLPCKGQLSGFEY